MNGSTRAPSIRFGWRDTGPGKLQSVTDFLLSVIPTTVVDAFAKGEILQVLLFAVLFGFALQRLGSRGAPVLTFID